LFNFSFLAMASPFCRAQGKFQSQIARPNAKIYRLVPIKTHVSRGFGVNASQPNDSRGRWIRRRSKFGNPPQDVSEHLP
jgi:hypothetical protein